MVKRLLAVTLIVVATYFCFFEIQSYLGKQALQATGLKSTGLAEALNQAKKDNRYILADMSAIWCPTCRKLDKKIFSNDKVKKIITDNYIFTRIEYESEEGEAFANKYQIHGFPTLLILDKDAKKIFQLPLTFDAELFIDYLVDFIEMKSLG